MSRLFVAIGAFCFLVVLTTSVYADTATLTIRSQYGTPSPAVGTWTYDIGAGITAGVETPVPGSTGIRYICTGWRARGSPDTLPPEGTANSIEFTITMNTTITWRWKTQYLLTTNASPTSGGIVDTDPTSTDGYYDAKSTIRLTATGDGPDVPKNGNVGYDFSYWSGGLRGTTNPQDLLLRGPRTVTANFIFEKRSFIVAVASYGGVPDPPVGPHEYDWSSTVTASCGVTPYYEGLPAGTRYVYVNYTGTGSAPAGPGSDQSIEFTILGIDIGETSSVTWHWKTQYQLTTVVNPADSGTLTLTPLPEAGGWYDANTVVSCNAAPNAAWLWGSWIGNLSGTTNPQNLTMNGPKSITANFVKPTLTVSNPLGYDTPDPAVGTHTYDVGASVTCSLTSPVSGGTGIQYTSTGWTGGSGNIPATGTAATYSFTINQNSTITWNWKTQYKLTIAANPPECGTATPSGETWYDADTVVTLTAEGTGVYGFSNWSGDLTGTENPKNIVMDAPKNVTANFGRPTLIVSNPSAYDTPVPAVGTYAYDAGTNVTCSMTPPSLPSQEEIPAVTYPTETPYSYRADENIGFIFTPKAPIVITTVMTNRGSGTVPVTIWQDIYEGFESGNIGGWTTGGSSTWWVTTGDKRSGVYSAQSGVLSNGQSNYIQRTYNLVGSGTVYFYWKASSQSSNNQLRFYIDGELKASISDQGWDDVSYSLAEGTRTLKWECYRGDSDYSITGYIDEIDVSGAGILLRTVNVTGASRGVWTEAAVSPPLELAAGTTYRIVTYFSGNDSYYGCEYNEYQISPDIDVDSGCSGEGPGYPHWGSIFGGLDGLCNFKYVKSRNLTYTGTGSCPSGPGSSVTFPIIVPSSITWDYGLRHPLQTTVRHAWYGLAGNGTIELSPTGSGSAGLLLTNWSVTNENYYARIGSAYFAPGTVVTLTAVPAPTYILDSWSEDLTGTANPQTLTMDAPKRVSATFAKPTLTVNNPGVTQALPSGYDTPNPTPGAHSYDRGTSVTCSITTSPWIDPSYPNAQRTCTGYTGTGSCPSGSGTTTGPFTMLVHSSITWNWSSKYKLITAVSPGGGGSITVDPVQTWYNEGSSVTLTAVPTANWAFYSWSGDATGSDSPKTITMSGVKSVTANFKHTVVVTSAYGAPSPAAGTNWYDHNASVTVSCGTTPYSGGTGIQYVNTGWTGGTGNIPATGSAGSYGPFTITQNSAITWTWQVQYYLTTAVTPTFPSFAGYITPDPSAGWYNSGAILELNAVANTGYAFSNWSGALTGSTRPQNLTMDGPKSVTANFTIPTPRTVTVTSAQGEPIPPVGATSCPDSSTVQVLCGPDPYPVGATGTRYTCIGWTGGSGSIPTTGGATSYSFTITANSTITWAWKVQYQLTTAVSPSGSGSVTPASGSWQDAGTVSCTAIANAGWGWVGWSGALTGTTNPQNLNMNGPKSITANFVKPTLTVYNPTGHDSPEPEVGVNTCDYGSSIKCSVASPEFAAISGTFTEDFEAGMSDWWVSGSDAKWFPATNGQQHAGSGCARSGIIYDTGSTYIERSWTIATGGGRITFWWKVSSQSGDYLRFYIDGSEQDAISGEVGWESRTYTVSAGTRTFKWTYTKDISGSSGDDCGWIDDIAVTNILFTDGFESGAVSWGGGGDLSWTATDAVKHSGTYSARSGAISAEDTSLIQGSFLIASEGGTLTFWWKVSSESGGDYLKFYIDGVEQAAISGEVDWALQTYSLSAGTRTIRWVYSKNIYVSSGSDCAWIDDVTVTNTTSTDGFELYGSLGSGWTTGGGTALRPEWFAGIMTHTQGFEAGSISGWTTSESRPWSATTAEHYSGTYSAKSGNLSGYHSYSYIEKTFKIGPGGSVTFWWKNAASSRVLRFYIDETGIDSYVAQISGNTEWETLTFPLSVGMHTLRWLEYSTATTSSGNGYIDDITVIGSSCARSADIGDFADYPDLPYGLYDAETNTYMERKFVIGEGGGIVTFLWKVSSETNYDWLEFYIDGVRKDRISGEVDWQQKIYVLDAGTRTLRWRYKKDSCWSFGSDCGWVDDIVITNIGNYPLVNYLCTGYTGTGSCPSGSSNSVTFTITQDSSITWYWKTVYLLTVSVYPPDSGTVTPSPLPIVYGYYDVDASVTLTAGANAGYQFGEWTGDLTGNTNPETITMTEPKSVTANFTGQSKLTNFAGVSTGPTTITWSWVSDNADWQYITAGVLRTLYSTLKAFRTTYGDLPPNETCPRDGTGDQRLLFETSDDLPGGDPQDCPTVDASAADTYTITYTRVSSTSWTCTADTYLTILKDFYIDETGTTGTLRQQTSTGNGPQANAGSPIAPDDTWIEIQNSSHTAMGTVYPNLTSYQETGLWENEQYTRHVHAVNAGVYGAASDDVSRYTLVHDATPSDFTVAAGITAKTRTIGAGTEAKRYPMDAAYKYARCQFLLYGAEVAVYQPGKVLGTDELGQGGIPAKIVKIRFQRAAGDWDEDYLYNVEMHMTHTTAGNLIGGWVDTSTHQLVLSGDLSVPYGGAGTWYEIGFVNNPPVYNPPPGCTVSPFYFDGSSNLIISFRHQSGMKEDITTTWRTELRQSGVMGHCGRCVALKSDANNPPDGTVAADHEEPGDLEYPAYCRARIPNVQIDFEIGGVTITVTAPAHSTAGLTGVRIERAEDSSFTTGLTVVQPFPTEPGSAVYTKTELPPTPVPPAPINYWYRIRFQNTEAVPSAYSEGQMVTVPVP
jgi:hypothetical protein